MKYYYFNPKFIINKNQTFIKELLTCNNFEKSDRLLGFSRGRGITWFLNTKAELGVDCVLRHYYRGGLFSKFVKDLYFFQALNKTRAMQEFHLLEKMLDWGLPVPCPIAVKIERHLGCYQADILLEKIANTQDLSKYLQQSELTATQYQQIGALIRQLHNYQVHHSDLNIHNILLNTENNKFWLIDFDKCQIQSGEQWKSQNLARLLRSFQKEQKRLNIKFSLENWQNILLGYETN